MRKRFSTVKDEAVTVQDHDNIADPAQEQSGIRSQYKWNNSPVIRTTKNSGPFCWQPKAALRKIRDACGNVGDGASVLALYVALTEIASDHQSERFETTQDYIARKCCLGIRTVRLKMKVLVDLGLVVVHIPERRAPGVYTLLSVNETNAPQIGSGCRTFGNRRKQSSLPTQEECSEESFEDAAGCASSPGAKRPPCEAQGSSRKNSRKAAEPAAPAAVVDGVPSEQAGAAAPGTPARDAGAASIDHQNRKEDHPSHGMHEDDDPEVEKAKKRTDKLLRYASQAYENLLANQVVHGPLGDRLERARAPIAEFLQEHPWYRVARVVETLIRVWETELSDNQWYSAKLKESPFLLPVILGKGEKRKPFSVLEGAALEFGINLAQRGNTWTMDAFASANILETWEAEHPPKGEVARPASDHEEDQPEIESEAEKRGTVEPQDKESPPEPVSMTQEKSDVIEPPKPPPSTPVGRRPKDRPSSASRKYFG